MGCVVAPTAVHPAGHAAGDPRGREAGPGDAAALGHAVLPGGRAAGGGAARGAGAAAEGGGQPPHVPELEEVPVPEGRQALWEQHGGAELDPVLGSGAVVLLSSEFVVRRAGSGGFLEQLAGLAGRPCRRARALAPRQALPGAAFLPPGRVRAATVSDFGGFLKIACVSHCWLQADHPDPRGHNLSILGRVFRLMDTDGYVFYRGSWAVFLDFCCMHQDCRDRESVPQQRTYKRLPNTDLFEDGAVGKFKSEAVMFREALGGLGSLYSHPKTFVFMLTQLPADYDDPAAYTRSGNVEQYLDRGWCFCELSLAMFAKSSYMLLDLGTSTGREDCYYSNRHKDEEASLVRSCARARKAPVLPDAFASALEAKGFAHGEDDRPRVAELYRAAFARRLSSAEVLRYDGLGWGDEEVQQVAAVLASSAASRLQILHLDGNRVGDGGAARLAEALSTPGALPALRLLRLERQAPPLGAAGRAALKAAWAASGRGGGRLTL